jgi:hypothetical protein
VSADVDANGTDDLVFSSPVEGIVWRSMVTETAQAGMVHVVRRAGAAVIGHQTLFEGSAGVPGSPGAEDRFGWALA